MSLKTEIKLHILHEQGVKADDMLEAARARQAAHDGAKQALRVAAKHIAQLAAVVDQDVTAGTLPLDEPAKIAAYAKLMVDRAVNAALSAAQHQENLQIAAGGEITAYSNLVALLKKDLAVEQGKLDHVKALTAEPPVLPEAEARAVGVHPRASIADMRRAEDAVPPVVPVHTTPAPKGRGKAKVR